MSVRKKPIRKCVACREHKDKKELLRLVKMQDGDVLLDFTHRANGRGAYVCKDEVCLEKAIKQDAFSRALKCKVGDSAIRQLREAIKRAEET